MQRHKAAERMVRGSEVEEQTRGGGAGRKECNMGKIGGLKSHLDKLWIPT